MDHLFSVAGHAATAVTQTSLAAERLLERQHLQEWVIGNPQVLGESVLVITVEFDRWADADGVLARDRLDVLGLDATGRLVVVELKRDTADRDVHLQAITYAALVSRFDLGTLAQAHHDFLARRGLETELAECRQRILDHIDGEWSQELLQRPRLMIIAADFPKQVTHTVVWLSEMKLDIDLVQVSLWKIDGNLVAGFTQVYPTPEVEEFTLAPARIEADAVAEKLKERSRARNAVQVITSAGLLPDGTRLRLVPRHGVPDAIRKDILAWVQEADGRGSAVWTNGATKPLTWSGDGTPFSPTGLAEHIFTSVTGRTVTGVQGTTWWDVDTDRVPDGVDPDEWTKLAGTSLAALASKVSGTRKDWTDLHSLLAAIPKGRWTTYGDVAAAVESHPVPIGTHLASCRECPAPWRVLTAAGKVSTGFRWSDPQRTETPEDILLADEVPIRDGIAAPAARMSGAELRALLNS